MSQKHSHHIWLVLLITVATGGMPLQASPQTDPVPLDLQDPADPVPLDLEDPANRINPLDLQDPASPLADPQDNLLSNALNQAPPAENRINRQVVGWRQAGTGFDAQRLGSSLRANWVMLNETQGLDGRVVGVSGPLTISLLRNGLLVSQVKSDEFGIFRFEAATPGTYTLVGYSKNALFTFGFIAVDRHNESLSMPLMIEPRPVYGRENVKMIIRLIEDLSPQVRFRPFGDYDIGETGDDPAEFYGWRGIPNITDEIQPATTITHQPVAMLQDGRLLGRIHQVDNQTGRPVEVNDTHIKIIQNGELVAETQTDMLGVFEVSGLLPGEYALVAGGADGLATVGISLIEGNPTSDARYQPATAFAVQPVTWQRNEPVVFDALLADQLATGWINSWLQEEEYQQAVSEPRPEFVNQRPLSPFNAGYGPGFGGGAPENSSLSSLTELLFVGAIGVAIAEAARTETVFGGGIPLISPFFP